MNPIRHFRRLAGVLAGLACTWGGLAVAAPAEAIAQIADDTRHARADRFGVRQIELYHNGDGKVYCLLDGPDEQAIRQHHAALGVPCGDVHKVDSL